MSPPDRAAKVHGAGRRPGSAATRDRVDRQDCRQQRDAILLDHEGRDAEER